MVDEPGARAFVRPSSNCDGCVTVVERDQLLSTGDYYMVPSSSEALALSNN